jgi:hypothetical protein
MTNQDPSGAVDNDFDDAATDAEAQLRKNIAEFPAGIKRGDIVIDLVEGRPLYVRERKGTAVDVFEREAFDLTTYKAHPWLPIGPHDDVFECVFLPTKPSDIPSKKKSQTYSYPRGRLARVPVEWLYDSNTHRHAEHTIETLARLFENAVNPDYRQAVVDVAVDTFGEEWADLALEVAGHDPSKYGADADDRSQEQDPVAVLEESGDATPVHEAVEEAPDPKGSTEEDTEDAPEDGELGDFEPSGDL